VAFSIPHFLGLVYMEFLGGMVCLFDFQAFIFMDVEYGDNTRVSEQ
jgi:hypothetical protein